ncbi:hypothetical protein [Qipengyuania sphaerica]|uniref:hypothetical protein n=1 Tax=Qipengyuania sphaerica TaxID=2867243 RepID=UPI001C887487|nr:hypothetical protein [Qipengyuania sphaerica]MBX7539589.1 hypothetical protein [Qipengyuania sphaerica]
MNAGATAARGWAVFFWLSAAYNLVIGLGGFLDARWGSPEAIMSVLIFCFGIVYALVARDPLRFAPALIAGILGKVMVVLMLGPPNWAAGGDAAIGVIVAGDLLFAIGFALFLLRAPKHG